MTGKKPLSDSPLLFCVLALLIIGNIQHADAQDDALIFNEDALLADGSQTESKLDLTQFFTGELGYSNAQNSFSNRTNSVLKVGLDVPANWGRFFMTVGAAQTDYTLRQRINDGLLEDPNNILPETRTTNIKTDKSDVQEGFVQFNLGAYVSGSIGRQKNAWGQFEFFSPVAAMLPVSGNIYALLPTKLDFLHPQDQVSLSIYPTSKTEIQFYNITSSRTDVAVDGNFASTLLPDDNEDGTLVADGLDQHTLLANIGGASDGLIDKPIDDSQTAARILFYPNWGVVGFTYHQGISANDPLLRAPVELIKGVIPNADPNAPLPPETIASTYKNSTDTYIYYPEGELIGFELAIPTGPWTWRYEYSMIDTVRGLGFNGKVNFSSDMMPFDGGKEFIDTLNDDSRPARLRGTALYHAYVSYQSLGFLYEKGKWTANVTIVNRSDPQPKGEADKEIVRQYDALQAQRANRDDGDDINTAPIMFIVRKAGEENQHRMGVNVGALGAATGFSVFYNYNFTENITLGGSVGELDLTNGQNSDRTYQPDDTGGITSQVSFGWRF